MSVRATRPVAEPVADGVHPCPRCGIVREARKGSLCRDCRSALNRAERAAWAS